MKSRTKVILIVLAVVLITVLWAGKAYNKFISKSEDVKNAWADVESVYQRRSDLIPNLVKTVQGAADFEKGTLESVINARNQATNVQLNADELTPENMAKFQKAQDNLSGSLNRLMVVVERYPELKATQNFQDLQAQLEGTENRISVERQKYNKVVNEYNTAIKSFPKNMIAKMFGFTEKAPFAAIEGADRAPEVDFNFGS